MSVSPTGTPASGPISYVRNVLRESFQCTAEMIRIKTQSCKMYCATRQDAATKCFGAEVRTDCVSYCRHTQLMLSKMQKFRDIVD